MGEEERKPHDANRGLPLNREIQKLDATPFSLGLEGEVWEPRLRSLVVPASEGSALLVCRNMATKEYIVLTAGHTYMSTDILMIASVVSKILEEVGP